MRFKLDENLPIAAAELLPPGEFGGIVVLRPRTQGRESALKLVARLVSLLVSERLDNNLWILDEHNLRLREGEKNLDADS